MGDFFSVDGTLFKFMRRLLDVLKLNMLWLLCSIPLVTIGPATIAAYTITLQMVDETEGYIAKPFFKAFKSNLKNGIPLGILFLLALEVIYIDFQLLNSVGDWYFLLVLIMAVFIFFMSFVYAFALSARYENTLIKTLKNSYDIAVRYFLRTLALALVLVVEFLIFFAIPATIMLFILIGPTCIFLTISGFAMFFFREIEKEDGAVIRKEKQENKDAVFVDHPAEDKGISKRANMNTKKIGPKDL